MPFLVSGEDGHGREENGPETAVQQMADNDIQLYKNDQKVAIPLQI